VREGAEEWDRIVRENQPFANVQGKVGNGKDKARLYRADVLEAGTKKNCVPPVHAFFDQAEAYLSMRERLDASFSLARLRLIRGLLQEAGAQLRDLKLSRQVISFNDMLSNVHERLDDRDYPELAGAIKQRFPAALIDEFQDTDPLQFDIFRRIYTGGDSHVFVVGDPKQAIYSFRNADLHTYLGATGWATNRWALSANQRSSEPLLTGINGLFEANAQAFILRGLDYRHVSFGDKRRSVWLDATEPRAPLQLWTLPQGPGGPLPKVEARRAAVRATAAEIARLVQAGSLGQVTLDGEPLRPRDIAVLVRSRALGSDMKQALAALRVGAVEISRSSVFHAAEAQDLETVLTAILSPAREPLVRAALATDLVGCTVSDIEAISGTQALLMDRVRQFTEYRDLWFRRGFGLMYRRLLADQAVAQRLLLRPDGERRLTNFLHLGEILHQAAQTYVAPDALWRHLKAERDGEDAADAVQLRLESDQNLVQIVTIHTCKGLEYPVVFCPFVCDGAMKFGGSSLEGREYHDDELKPVVDFRQWDKGDPERVRIEGVLRSEQAAETVRLLYVALTRAVHRCYLVTGTYNAHRSDKESARSMLNWLVAGRDLDLNAWFENGPGPADIDAAWQRFAAAHAASVARSPLPPDAGSPLVAAVAEAVLDANLGAVVAAGGWKLSSYSGLNFGAKSDQAANDRDARVVPAPDGATLPAGLLEDDILRFPRGASAGECIHAVFENIDFTDESTWDPSIAAALERHPQARLRNYAPEQPAPLAGMLRNLIRDVTTATLLEGLQLRSVPLSRRLTELEFTFPVPHLPAAELNDALKEFGYDMPALRFGSLEGYLKGFVDLVFEHQNRYFILDWKSNHLGYQPADYGPAPLARSMAEHGYHLQYLLYTVALDRYLRRRLPAYRYEEQLGGVLYLFVRGIRAAWPGTAARPGVYFHRPTGDVIQRLNEILDRPVRRAAV
jgi:exodeoxyribonuclease V beta subunit